MKPLISLVCFPVGVSVLLAFAGTATAQEVIKSPTAHTQYFAELEPHLAFKLLWRRWRRHRWTGQRSR